MRYAKHIDAEHTQRVRDATLLRNHDLRSKDDAILRSFQSERLPGTTLLYMPAPSTGVIYDMPLHIRIAYNS